MTFQEGTSLRNLSQVVLSKRAAFWSLSLTLPLDHFFFLPLPEDMAALALASLDFGSWGAFLFVWNEERGKLGSGFQRGRRGRGRSLRCFSRALELVAMGPTLAGSICKFDLRL